jgi:hypothetical protein
MVGEYLREVEDNLIFHPGDGAVSSARMYRLHGWTSESSLREGLKSCVKKGKCKTITAKGRGDP